jgi:Gpi18-like mannosyltransferase
MIGAFFFSLAAMTRSTGILLSIFIAHKMLPKILFIPNFGKIFKGIMYSWIAALMILTPMLVIQYIKPYQLHCDPKIDRTDVVPTWCLDSIPNVYNYIQFVYWDNRLLGVLFRKWDHLLVSLPMFIIFFGIMYKIAQKQGKNLLTLGLFGY